MFRQPKFRSSQPHRSNTQRTEREKGHVPIFAGLCQFTEDCELPGSRTGYQHLLQDALDQRSIVSRYCSYVGELRIGRTDKQLVAQALQFAMSDPKGPVYLAGAREVMATYHIDVDPLNCMMSNSHFPAHGRWKADNYTALTQLNTSFKNSRSE